MKSAAKPFQPGPSGASNFLGELKLPIDLGLKLPSLGEVETALETHLGILPYPTADQRAAREAHIEAAVAQMKLSPGGRQALALLAAEHVSAVDLWHGSHCIAAGDGGKLYDQLCKLSGTYARTSSHYPLVKCQQYALPLGGGELLFGKTADGSTWFQMEAHPFHDGVPTTPELLNENVMHLLDYAKYQLVHQNIGPMGTSPHTEHSDPVIVG